MSDILTGGVSTGTELTGGLSNFGTQTSTAMPPVTAGAVAYCTLPLQIGASDQGGQAVSRIDWKQYQTSPILALLLLDATGQPLNLTGARSVTLRLSSIVGGIVVAEAMTPLWAAGGVFGYTLQDADVADDGTYQLEVEAIDAQGRRLYLPTDGYVLFVIRRALGGP